MNSFALPLRPELAGLEPYGAPQILVPAPLNVNENPYAPSPAVQASITTAVAAAASSLNRYPDRDFLALRTALAAYLRAESQAELSADNIWAANGSNEVMVQILQAFAGPGRNVLSFTPTYSMYHEYARDTASNWIAGPRLPDFSLDLAQVRKYMEEYRPAVVLLASPNNPTGTALPLSEVEEILNWAATTGPETGQASVVVIDEAYAEFRRPGVRSATELLSQHPHLAVSRTMSKAFGMAGLRLGYLAAGTAILDGIKLVRLPYHLSAITQAAALAALSHQSELQAQVGQLREARDELAAYLVEQGWEVASSDANFVMFGQFANRTKVWQELLAKGVLIREVGPAGWLRVSVGTPAQMEAFRQALKEVSVSD